MRINQNERKKERKEEREREREREQIICRHFYVEIVNNISCFTLINLSRFFT